MTSSGPRRIARLLALTLAPVLAPMLASPVLAQTTTQDSDAAGRSSGGLDGFSLTPRASSPQSAQTPVPTPPTPRLVLPGQSTPEATPTPTPRATPALRPTPRPTPAPSPTPTPSPTAEPTPLPSPEPPATRLPDPETPMVDRTESMDGMTIGNGQAPAIVAPGTTAPEQADTDRALPFWPLLIGTGLAALLIGIWLGRRSRPARAQSAPMPRPEPAAEPVATRSAAPDPRPAAPAPEPIAPPAPPALPPLPPEPSFLAVEARPLRVGLNMLSATIEAEVTVRNTGATPIGRVAVDLRLLSAHAGLDEQLVELAYQPQGRPVVPPFALAPGESRTVRGVTALPREAIHVIDAAGRPMFVPILAAAAHTDWGVARCTYAVGLARADSTKLSPIWLDQPGRMYDQIAARPHVMRG
ncbi:hypothetical protein QE363_000919 [Sphingomonas sp. SORGH_AS870]|uniref:hypothetical protein n=1 Tax=Sphingomonas sp. SORGH_AS_0870 TaxID=3041801 RepID=UPI00285F0198|nr:hypothetical protein [Sphingomonas sp. SORGH_AS_0870]MDR6145126.1 hypothetical protein [Sphingomonas sp. SORGH_AS_0870]